MGSLKLVIFAIKIATNKKVTYDHVVAITSASPCDGHRVKEFRNGISVSNPDTDDIADYTIPDGGINRSVTSSVETSYTKDGAATAYSLSYSYNPDGMDVTPKLYENRIRWTCEPANSPTNNNETFKFEPSIILRKSNGKTSQTTVKSYVSYFRINGLSKKKYVAEETISCGITFKNHKLISKT